MKTETKQRLELLLNEIMMLMSFIVCGSTLTNHRYLYAGITLISGIYFYGITTLTSMKYNYKPFYYKILPKKTREYYNTNTLTITQAEENQDYKVIKE